MATKSKVHTIYAARAARLKAQQLLRRLIIPLIIVAIVSYWVSVPAIKLVRERGENKILQSQLTKQLQENKEVKGEIKRLGSNAYIEQRARRDLGLVKPNEIQYYVLMKKTKIAPKTKKQPKKWWNKTFDFLEAIFTK